MIRLAVTGTDTGVGKSVISATLLSWLRGRGLHVAGMKPVETGVLPRASRSDARLLHAAAGGRDRIEDVCPFILPEPLAPWIAARRAGISIDLESLDRAFIHLTEGRDVVVVEGAGGLLVPLTRTVAFDALFRRWNLDVVLVAGNRLGVINHTLLTLQAARAAGLHVRGVVLNALSPRHSELAEATNHQVLIDMVPNLPVIPFPWLDQPGDLDRLAEAARRCGLEQLIDASAPPRNETLPTLAD